MGDKTDHYTKASIKEPWHQGVSEKGWVGLGQGAQTCCHSDDQKSYLRKGQTADPRWVPKLPKEDLADCLGQGKITNQKGPLSWRYAYTLCKTNL